MQWWVLVCWALLVFGGGGSEAPPPAELLSGYSHGFTRVVRITRDKRVQFLDGRRVVLDLPAHVAAKWVRYNADLQFCYLDRPALSVKNGRGVSATIYRFEGGIIVDWAKGTFALSTHIVMQWEAKGGYKGPKGFPLTDAMPIIRLPPPKIRSVFISPPGNWRFFYFFRLQS